MKIKKRYKNAVICTLKCYKLLPARINDLQKELNDLEINDGVRGISYSGDGIKTNKISKIVEDTALENIFSKKKINEDISEVNRKLSRLDDAMESLIDIQKQVVVMRYVDGLAWTNLADELRYSERDLRRKLDSAVDNLAYIFYGSKAFEDELMNIV